MPEPPPPEILDRILDYLHDDRQTLSACALAGRIMLPTSRYHRFREVTLTARRASTLMSLIESAPELAQVVTSIQLYHGWTAPTQELVLLSRFPALSSLGILVRGHLANALPVVALHAPALKSLLLVGTGTLNSQDLIRAIAKLGALEELRLLQVRISTPPDVLAEEIAFNVPPPPRLCRLECEDNVQVSLLGRWFQAHSATSHLRSLKFYIANPWDVVEFNVICAGCAHTLTDLEVIFVPDGRMAAALGDTALSLSSLSKLESCALRFVFGEMCVAENESLASIPTLLAQLSSPNLDTVTVALVVDNVEDLRSLNSECAVRKLSPAYFDDMRVLDWTAIENSLASDRLCSLRKFVLEGQGDEQLLRKHVEDCCPSLHPRRILSLAAADKSWRWSIL